MFYSEQYGSHHELYKNDGLYKEMFDRQSEFYRGEAIPI